MEGARKLLLHGSCMCNYVPHLWEYMDLGDIAALIAPRGLVVETGDRDGIGCLENVLSQVTIIRSAYQLLGVKDKFIHDIFPGGHKWNGLISIPFMKKVLLEAE